jgi:hypothetical protein
MIRWGIGLLLLGLLLSVFFAGSNIPNEIAGIGKVILIIGLVIWAAYVILGAMSRSSGPPGPI